ncbi:MAG: glycosyltransferase family 2 protein [Lachnospiraceae bacterium]|nr:glycosyltransferase family 2 protein [Lachnospiraceae bacterium]
MRLQILIPHYRESEEVLKPLLDSIAIQQNVDFSEVGVVICHDGEEARDLDLGDGYPFLIEQIRQEHRGVSAARNSCLDHAVADYVMFCDADDMFFNACGIWILFREMANGGFDSLVSNFVEESRLPNTGEVVYINHEMDSTFVHGKVHRRDYLIEKGIRWDERLTIHEDSYFNIQCQNLSTNVKYCQTPFYLWRWRDESVCRHDPKYILKTYRNMLDSNDALIDQFLRRGVRDKAMFFTVFMIFDSYYTMNKPEWVNQDNKDYRDSTEKRFAAYFAKHKPLWDAVSSNDKMVISNQVRARNVMEGMQMEAVTIDGWLQHIQAMI